MENAIILGQIIFALFFLFNALNHFTKAGMLTGYARSKGVPLPGVAIFATGLMLLFGGAAILTGWYLTEGIILLLIFLVVISFWMHNFWADKDAQAKMGNMVNFMKNFALIGALLMMLNMVDNWPWTL